MSTYTIFLFLHVSGAIGYFVIIVALALGLASGLLVSRVTRTQWQNVAAQENHA